MDKRTKPERPPGIIIKEGSKLESMWVYFGLSLFAIGMLTHLFLSIKEAF